MVFKYAIYAQLKGWLLGDNFMLMKFMNWNFY